jgi:hypothetical protein
MGKAPRLMGGKLVLVATIGMVIGIMRSTHVYALTVFCLLYATGASVRSGVFLTEKMPAPLSSMAPTTGALLPGAWRRLPLSLRQLGGVAYEAGYNRS